MGTSYIDKLGEWVGQRESTRRDRNLVAFLAVREDVESALREGFAARTVWLNLYESGRIPFKYTTFLLLVNRHITPANVKRPPSQTRLIFSESARPVPAKAASTARTDSIQPEPIRGFVFNPIPRKEDLI